MPVYEIASWTGSDALIADRDVLKLAYDEIAKSEGCIRCVNFFLSIWWRLLIAPTSRAYYGVAEVEKKIVIIVAGKSPLISPPIFVEDSMPEWDKYEDHKALEDDAIRYPIVQGLLAPAIGEGPFKMHHVYFNKSPIAALGAPTTAFLELTLKDGHSKDQLEKTVIALTSQIGSEHNVTWGPAKEDGNKFFLVIGWKSLKVRTSRAVLLEQKTPTLLAGSQGLCSPKISRRPSKDG